MLSIIYPDAVTAELDLLRELESVELICVEKNRGVNRAQRLNIGISQAKGEMILLHHPRSHVDRKGIEYLVENQKQVIWGGFRHTFNSSHPLLKYTSWYSNELRPRISKILYLDHCIFFHRSLLAKPIPEVPIFEDTLLCYQLRDFSRPVVLPFESITSPIRYEKNGVLTQAAINQILKIGFYVGIPLEKLNNWYERGLGLN